MEKPRWDDAHVPLAKIKDYLMCDTHPVGHAKARLFRALGYLETNPSKLQRDLVAMANPESIQDIVPLPHGTKYILDGQLQTPGGRMVRLRTIWMVDAGHDRPRFVTAYPR